MEKNPIRGLFISNRLSFKGKILNPSKKKNLAPKFRALSRKKSIDEMFVLILAYLIEKKSGNPSFDFQRKIVDFSKKKNCRQSLGPCKTKKSGALTWIFQ